MLGRVICDHWYPLVRDVLALGFRAEDILTTLTVAEMVAIVVAAPPTSSVRYFLDGGWSREAQLLANMHEGSQGLRELSSPYARPGTEQVEGQMGVGASPDQIFRGDAMTWDEMDELDAKRQAVAEEMAAKGIKPTNTRVRTI